MELFVLNDIMLIIATHILNIERGNWNKYHCSWLYTYRISLPYITKTLVANPVYHISIIKLVYLNRQLELNCRLYVNKDIILEWIGARKNKWHSQVHFCAKF